MGIGDTKIGKSELGAFARKIVSKGRFNQFAQDFSKDISNQGLDGLTASIQEETKSDKSHISQSRTEQETGR